MLNKGDVAVYGNHGLCKVSDLLVPSFLPKGSEKMYYQMVSAIDRGGVLYVPIDGAMDKMRDVISQEEASNIMNSLDEIEILDLPAGKKAEAVISDVCKRNEAYEMIRLIKSLYRIKAIRTSEGKKFAAVDERYLGVAEKLFYSEIAYALDTEWDDIKEKVVDTLSSLPLESEK